MAHEGQGSGEKGKEGYEVLGILFSGICRLCHLPFLSSFYFIVAAI
jgi:hypothetical protein